MASLLSEHYHWAFAFSTVPVFGLYALNDVAGQLEMPFGQDPNDLPLEEFQEHMNTSMLMLVREEADNVPDVDMMTFAHDYNELRLKISTQRPHDFIRGHMEEMMEHHHFHHVDSSAVGPPQRKANQQTTTASSSSSAPTAVTNSSDITIGLEVAQDPVVNPQAQMAELNSKLAVLMQSTGLLSEQMCRSTKDFTQIVNNLCDVSKQLEQSAKLMLKLQPADSSNLAANHERHTPDNLNGGLENESNASI